jgi:hypothetical protein
LAGHSLGRPTRLVSRTTIDYVRGTVHMTVQ